MKRQRGFGLLAYLIAGAALVGGILILFQWLDNNWITDAGVAKGRAALQKELDEEAARVKVKQAQATEVVVTRYVKVAGATEIITKEVEKEVIRYAATNPDGACIDADFVRLHNAAASNALPGTTSRPDGPLRAPGLDPEGIRFPYRVPSIINRDGELRETSPLRRLDGRMAELGY